MFGKAPSTIRAACWEYGLPYRLETTWDPAAVNQVLGAAAAAPRPRPASHNDQDSDARR
jgi:hypothetical protein